MSENKIPLQKIMEDCKKSKKKIALKDVTNIVEGSLSLLYNQGSILKRVEKTIGDEDFNILVTSCLSTLMGSLYATCEGKFKNEQEAIKYGQSIGAMGIAFKKGK